MEDLSLHILDIMRNAVESGADTIRLRVNENAARDRLTLSVQDNGPGMSRQTLRRAVDPFFTTKGKKVGLGLSLLKQATMMSGGSFGIDSRAGKGTKVKASFRMGNIDRQPLGSVMETVVSMLASTRGLRIIYVHVRNGKKLTFDSGRPVSRRGGAAGDGCRYGDLWKMKEAWERKLGSTGATR
jgi:anti-sigma regulatory factor (Ser/Thr protein kinase)